MNIYIIELCNRKLEIGHTLQDEQFIRDCCAACNVRLVAFYEQEKR